MEASKLLSMFHSSSAHDVLCFYIFRFLSAFLFSTDKSFGIYHCRRKKALRNILKVYSYRSKHLIRRCLSSPVDDHGDPWNNSVTFNVKDH